MKQDFKMKIGVRRLGNLLTGSVLLTFGFSAYAIDFNCTSVRGLKSDPQDYVTVRGSLESDGNLKNVNLSLVDKTDPTEHTLIEAVGPIAVVSHFRPTANRLKSFDKYVLSKERGDSFQFFVPHARAAVMTRAFVRISFEDTKPDLEELVCTSTP